MLFSVPGIACTNIPLCQDYMLSLHEIAPLAPWKAHSLLCKSATFANRIYIFCILKYVKGILKEKYLAVISDFREKYYLTTQYAIQGYHWTNDQGIIHSSTAYFVNDVTLEYFSVVVSDWVNLKCNIACFPPWRLQNDSGMEFFINSPRQGPMWPIRRNIEAICHMGGLPVGA